MSEKKTFKEEERVPFDVSVAECEAFEGICSQKFMDSDELCRKVVALFKSAYADLEGAKFEVSQQGKGYISLFFNHSEPTNDPSGRVCGVTRFKPDDNAKPINNSLVATIRSRDMRNKSGDRYYLTTEGMEGLTKYVDDQFINRKNNTPMWDKIVAEVSAKPAYYGQPPITYTKVSMIDPLKFIMNWYGETDEYGNNIVYDFSVRRSIPVVSPIAGNFEPRFFVVISAVSEREVLKLSNDLGVTPNVGINIIRG